MIKNSEVKKPGVRICESLSTGPGPTAPARGPGTNHSRGRHSHLQMRVSKYRPGPTAPARGPGTNHSCGRHSHPRAQVITQDHHTDKEVSFFFSARARTPFPHPQWSAPTLGHPDKQQSQACTPEAASRYPPASTRLSRRQVLRRPLPKRIVCKQPDSAHQACEHADHSRCKSAQRLACDAQNCGLSRREQLCNAQGLAVPPITSTHKNSDQTSWSACLVIVASVQSTT